MGNPWTEAMDADLIRLWGDMKSGTQCADEMGRLYPERPFTRCSILGRLHRIGDRKNPLMCGVGVHQKRRGGYGGYTPRKRPSRAKQSITTGQYVRKVVQQPTLAPENIPFHLLQRDQCKYIASEVTSYDAIACGAPVWERESYCLAHCWICYSPPRRNGARVMGAPSGTIASVPPPAIGAVVPLQPDAA